MPDINDDIEITKEVTKEIAKDVYDDVGHPIAKPIGELVGLVPRAIKAALASLEIWILKRENKVEEVSVILEEKLKNVPPENIVPPEPHIAVPAVQYISYCMDNYELKNMYANLLANSMNKVVKNGVHPGFVEIIKQLSPDEAKILKYLSIHTTIPTITLRYENDNGEGVSIIKNFSNVGELVGCENPLNVNQYFDNMIRLGLLESASSFSSLTKKTLYDPLKNHPYIKKESEKSVSFKNYEKAVINESFVSLTDYGRAFCSICLSI